MTASPRYRALLRQFTGSQTTAPRRPRLQRVLLRLLCGVLGAVAVWEGFNAPYPVTAVATGICGVVCLLALAAPKGSPGWFTALAAGASLLVSVVEANLAQGPENTPGMVELCVLLLLVTRTVRYVPPLKAAGLALLPALAGVVLPVRIDHWSADPHVILFIEALAVGALPFAVTLGGGLRLRDRLRDREHEHIRQEQRLEHARELHDFVAHHVTAVVAQAQAARFTTAAGHTHSPQDLDEMLGKIEQAGAQALGSMRAMVTVLRSPAAPAATRPPGDLSGLVRLTEEFSALGPPAGLRLDPHLAGAAFPPETAATVFHVVREALTNVRKHADRARQVEVRVVPRPEDPGRLEVSVRDDGHAHFSARSPGEAKGEKGEEGFGLIGLAERVEAAGGELTAGHRESGGWQVLATLPLGPAPDPGPGPVPLPRPAPPARPAAPAPPPADTAGDTAR